MKLKTHSSVIQKSLYILVFIYSKPYSWFLLISYKRFFKSFLYYLCQSCRDNYKSVIQRLISLKRKHYQNVQCLLNISTSTTCKRWFNQWRMFGAGLWHLFPTMGLIPLLLHGLCTEKLSTIIFSLIHNTYVCIWIIYLWHSHQILWSTLMMMKGISETESNGSSLTF